jgi:integrase
VIISCINTYNETGGDKMLLAAKYQSIQDHGIPTLKTYANEYVNEFLEDKRKNSHNTYRAYKSDTKSFFLDVFEKEIEHITVEHLSAVDYELLKKYRDNLYSEVKTNGDRKNSNDTINRKIQSIISLMKDLKKRKVVQHDVTQLNGIEKLPKDGKSIPHMSVEDSFKVANWLKENEKHKQEEKYNFVLLAIESGLRVGELLSLTLDQFTERDGVVTLKGRGKGNQDFLDIVEIQLYRDLLKLPRADNKIFSIKYSVANDMIKRACKNIGIDTKNYSAHSFKKTAVTFVYQETGSIQDAQKKGRHKDINTTMGSYIAEMDLVANGVISRTRNLNNELYKEVDPDILISTIDGLQGNMKMLINSAIRDFLNNNNK